ncbi:glycosyl hydrolase family 28-related protein [Citrobacter portucalensis]|uniref:glycosyl hydrolase family 28-related protein n=1 Tax=Citrobacter portucalensis TaxID=1639133 RepID=UPI001C7CD5AE|nr:glycosyl hydrolase family 28-related protein [Citrobacter portucalensis]
MTVSTEVNHNEYTGNGVTTSFPYTFRIFHASDLVVTTSDTNGTLRTLMLNTDYTVTGVGSYSGGAVVLPVPLANAWAISIERSLPVVQETDLRNQGKFFAETHESAFDYLTMLIQQCFGWARLALLKPSFIARYYDAKQNRIANLADPVGANDAVNFRTLLNMTDGGASDAILGLLGDTTNADNGDALIGVKQPLNSAVGRTQHSKNAEAVSVKDFGAKGDGVTDDTTALKNAITECARAGICLLWPAGTYLLSRIKVSGDNYVYNWQANGKVVLKSTATTPLGPAWIDDYFIRLEGGVANLIAYNSTINPGDTSVSINSAYTLDPNDVLMIQGNRLIQTDNRGQACEGEMHIVKSFDAITRRAELTGAAYFFYSTSNDYTTPVTAVVSGGEFSFGNDTTLTAQYNQVKVTGVTGANAGISRYITHWNNTTKAAKFEYVQGPFPFTPAVGDTFRITRRADLYKRKPCYGRITGDFHFVRPITYNAVAGDLGFRGLVIDGAVDMHIEGITVSGFSETGIFLESCYRTTLLNPYTEYANRGYNLTDGTGYGVEVYNCAYCTVENLVAFACRRGLDVSGTQMVSLYNNVINPVAMGGGIAYDGVKFFPGGETRNSCCGGHGPSYETSFVGGNSINQYYAAVIRGLNEVYDGLSSRGFSGPAVFFIRYSGGGLTVQNCNYIDSFTEASLPASLRYKPVPAAQRDNRPLAFIDMSLAQTDRNSYYKELPIVIKGNTARAVTKGFVRFEVNDGLTPLIQNIYFGDNLCIANPETSTSAAGLTEAVMVYSSVHGAQIVRNFHDLGGNRIVSTGAGYVSCGMFNTPDGIAGVIVQGSGKYLITVDPGKAVSVLISGYVPNIRLTFHDILRLEYSASAVGVMMHRGEAVDYSPLKDTNKQYLSLQTGVLTDGSGADGNLNVSFDLATLYFSNRMTNRMTLAVDVAGI